jgi:hypothetical protein
MTLGAGKPLVCQLNNVVIESLRQIGFQITLKLLQSDKKEIRKIAFMQFFLQIKMGVQTQLRIHFCSQVWVIPLDMSLICDLIAIKFSSLRNNRNCFR